MNRIIGGVALIAFLCLIGSCLAFAVYIAW